MDQTASTFGFFFIFWVKLHYISKGFREKKTLRFLARMNVIFDGRDTSPKNLNDIRQHFEKHGFVVANLLTADMCKSLIAEQWKATVLTQPWLEPCEVPGPDGGFLDPDRYCTARGAGSS